MFSLSMKSHHQSQLQHQLKVIKYFKPFLNVYIYITEILLLCVSSPQQDVSLQVITITAYSKQSECKSEAVMQ